MLERPCFARVVRPRPRSVSDLEPLPRHKRCCAPVHTAGGATLTDCDLLVWRGRALCRASAVEVLSAPAPQRLIILVRGTDWERWKCLSGLTDDVSREVVVQRRLGAHKDFSDLYEKRSDKGESASEAHLRPYELRHNRLASRRPLRPTTRYTSLICKMTVIRLP